jgi:hypothetical protein
MRLPLRQAEIAELPATELVQHREFLNGGDRRGFIPFNRSSLKGKIAAVNFPQPIVPSGGGAPSLWRAGDVQKWKLGVDRERLNGAAA